MFNTCTVKPLASPPIPSQIPDVTKDGLSLSVSTVAVICCAVLLIVIAAVLGVSIYLVHLF